MIYGAGGACVYNSWLSYFFITSEDSDDEFEDIDDERSKGWWRKLINFEDEDLDGTGALLIISHACCLIGTYTHWMEALRVVAHPRPRKSISGC